MLRRALLCACVGVMAAGAAAAETTRTLRAQLSGDPAAPFVVENLAGAMTVVAGDGDAVVAVATVHADDAALADAMRFEQVRNENGVPVLRVIYPLDRERTIRYEADGGDRHHGHRHHGLEWLFGSWDGTEVKYDGHRVRVSSSSGARLFADIEVRVPRRALSATFKNHVGELSAEGIEGRILLDTGRGGITARRLKGEIKADTGSGEVLAEDVTGSFSCDTGSGECNVTGFDGTELSCDTGSGEVRIRRAKADLIVADTGSGRIVVEQADAGEFRGDTGSGGIDAELTGTRLRRVKADTGSGHVSLRIPADASFEVFADQGSGSLHCGFADATAVKDDHKTVGYRRGDGKVRIAIDTGSGGATVDPAR
ncbi:MAG TPA: DUF4097 family beta strand repeat-containing protein [Thermoanaerobaculaceae bacterium]|nr:DUF4097 family beta strand repeat-containing protein [Thermoanaerobaculaceae bacterium]